MEFEIEIMPDKNGFLDRCCSHCGEVFKVKLDDWEKNIVPLDRAFCPYCGFESDTNSFFTNYQTEEIQNRATNLSLDFCVSEINKIFEKHFGAKNGNRSINVTYRPLEVPRFQNLPIDALKPFTQKFTCDSCNTCFSTFGPVFYCPCCGKELSKETFFQKITEIKDALSNIDSLFNDELAEDLKKQCTIFYLENSLTVLVSYFQKVTLSIYLSLGGSFSKTSSRNAFQNIQNGSKLLSEHIGYSYGELVSSEKVDFMVLEFQKRHCLEHNEGIADYEYLKKSGDKTNKVGNRIIIRQDEVVKLADYLEELVGKILDIANKQ